MLVWIFWIVVVAIGIPLIIRITRKQWREADVEEKIEDVEQDQELSNKISVYDVDEIEKNKEDLKKFEET